MSKHFFSPEQEQRIVRAIQQAEEKTSGEIKLHIQHHTRFDDPLDEARYCFKKLNLHQTKQRNAVLFFFNPTEHKIAVFGDEGLHKVLPSNYWDEMIKHMVGLFKKNEFVEAFEYGIEHCGQQLSQHFPSLGNKDINELSDEISEQ